MIAKEFKNSAMELGYSVEHTSSAYYIVKDGSTYAVVSRSVMFSVDTYTTTMSNNNYEDSLSLMALLFEFTTTPIENREDYNYRVYTMFEENENVGHKLYVTGYGDDGEKLALDVDIIEALSHPKATAEIIAERVSKITGNKFELEKVER